MLVEKFLAASPTIEWYAPSCDEYPKAVQSFKFSSPRPILRRISLGTIHQLSLKALWNESAIKSAHDVVKIQEMVLLLEAIVHQYRTYMTNGVNRHVQKQSRWATIYLISNGSLIVAVDVIRTIRNGKFVS
jgi:hypothetical protein